MDLENKGMGFQFEPERSISNKGFYQDSSDEGDALEQEMFGGKDCDKCRNCSKMKTEKECLCCHNVEPVRDFNLRAIFILSQAIILSELTHNLMISISICFYNQTWFQNPCHI